MKSQNAFKTIGEISAELSIAPHVLRFWEKNFYQIKPIKRERGRRYYRPEDVEIIKTIQSLLHQDRYTIKGAQKFLRNQDHTEVLCIDDIINSLSSLQKDLSEALQSGE